MFFWSVVGNCSECLISGRVIRHRACALKDTTYAIINTELDKDFEKLCESIVESRKQRGTYWPNYITLFCEYI